MKHGGTIASAILSIAILAAAILIARGNLAPSEVGVPVGTSTSDTTASIEATGIAAAVETITVESGTISKRVRLGGEVRAEDTVIAFPDTAGTVSRLLVDVGSVVGEDAPVAYVDPSRAGARYEQSPVGSPITGTVVAVNVARGESVGVGTPIVTVATLDRLEIEVEVPERYAPDITRGTAVTVTALAFPDTPITAAVTQVDPIINAATRSKTATIRVRDRSVAIEAGMFVQVEFSAQTVNDALIVPVDALVLDGEVANIFVVGADGIAEKRLVTTGLVHGSSVQITNGLSAGDEVVLAGNARLRANQPVRVVSAGGSR